jgi:hypothetical protein
MTPMSDNQNALADRCEGAAEAVLAQIAAEYGPGVSNGVAAILAHDALPERFDKSAWEDWFFKPADAAFHKAHSLGLIDRSGRTRWTLTPLGRSAAAALRSRLTRSSSDAK